MPIATPSCKGFLMAHQLPNYNRSTPIDPYKVVSCPHPPKGPNHLGPACVQSKHSRACGNAKWCEMHWCAGCKKANGVAVKAAKPAKMEGEVRKTEEQWIKEIKHIKEHAAV